MVLSRLDRLMCHVMLHVLPLQLCILCVLCDLLGDPVAVIIVGVLLDVLL